MTLEDLGNLGEFIGAFAVIATLIYVATQLRQNTQSLRTSSFQAAMQTASQDTRLLAQNAEVAALYLRGLESFSSLDPVERIRFQSLMPPTPGHTPAQSHRAVSVVRGCLPPGNPAS